MAEVVLEHVTKVYTSGIRAVNDLSLRVHDRELLVLVGPSGCGKSTTLRMIAGLEEVSGGTIRIGERVVTDLPPRERDIAMVFQSYALYPHMTVRENLAFGLRMRSGQGWLKKARCWLLDRPRFREGREQDRQIEAKVRSAAELLGLGDVLGRKPGQLSGGQRQRVAVGRAIVRHPQAFLFDEPLSNLDALLRMQMRKELKQLHQRLEATTVYVTHDQVEAMTLGDRIVVMREGVAEQVGTPAEVYERPRNRFVAGFIGTPPMNLIDGRLVESNDGVSFEVGGVSVKLSNEQAAWAKRLTGRRVTLGIRPEDIAIADAAGWDGERVALEAQVSVVEPLGDETIVYLQTGEQEWLGKTAARRTVRAGSTVKMVPDMGRAHLFDAMGGERLEAAGGEP